MIPNIAAVMATSPVLISSLVGLFGNVHGGSFTEAQVQTVLLTDAVTNSSTWAVAFHTTLALKEGIDPADVQAIREGRPAPRRQTCRAVGSGKNDDRKARAPRRRGRRSIYSGPASARIMLSRSSPSSPHPRSRLHRQHHEASPGGAVSSSRLGRMRYPGALYYPRARCIPSTGPALSSGQLRSFARHRLVAVPHLGDGIREPPSTIAAAHGF